MGSEIASRPMHSAFFTLQADVNLHSTKDCSDVISQNYNRKKKERFQCKNRILSFIRVLKQQLTSPHEVLQPDPVKQASEANRCPHMCVVMYIYWMCAGSSRYVQSRSACPAHRGWWPIAEGRPTSWTQEQVGIFLASLWCILNTTSIHTTLLHLFHRPPPCSNYM